MCHLKVIFKEWYLAFHFLAHVTQYPLIEPLKKTCYGPIWMNTFRINQNLRTHFFLHLAFLPSISHFLTYYQPFGLLTPCNLLSFLTTKSLNAISKMPHYYQDHHHQALLNCNFPTSSLASLGAHFHFIPNGMQKI